MSTLSIIAVVIGIILLCVCVLILAVFLILRGIKIDLSDWDDEELGILGSDNPGTPYLRTEEETEHYLRHTTKCS